MKMDAGTRETFWPALPSAKWSQTARTLHLWTQIVGKIRLASSPWINHSWHVTLYVTSRGLTTSPIPHGFRTFEIRFDFISHELRILVSTGEIEVIPLRPQSVAAFHREIMAALTKLKLPAEINPLANELPETIRLDEDEKDRTYDSEYANRFWRVLVQADRVFTRFRSEFCGKCSPVHFFWGSFDLAVTRFSGRAAPLHPGGVPHLPDAVTREAYSQEVSSLGFWPGNEQMPTPIFYSYAYPEPPGFADAKVTPAGAAYDPNLHEFTLSYDAVRTSDSPDEMLLEFARSAYDQASTLGKWDRAALEENKPSLIQGRHMGN
jgi:hypothetical protein